MRYALAIHTLILREMRHSRMNVFLGIATVLCATAMFTGLTTAARASVDATRVLMKNMGFNLLIAPPDADMARYQALDFHHASMPQELVTRLAESDVLAQHFVGKYQRLVVIEDANAILTGVLPEASKTHAQKKPMPSAYEVQPGEAFLGAAIARVLGKDVGEKLTVQGTMFSVARILPEVGTPPEDIRVFVYLDDAQRLFDCPGEINAIDALACQCPVDIEDIVGAVRKSIHDVLPEVQVIPYQSLLLARQEQRASMQQLQLVIMLLVIFGAAAAVWGLTHQNMRYRIREIGVYRAIGIGSTRIWCLCLGRVLLFSFPGALLGALAGHFGVGMLYPAAEGATLHVPLLVVTVLCTPLVAALFAVPPVLSALLRDPTDILGDAAP